MEHRHSEYHQHEEEQEEVICRSCHEREPAGDLIAPCRCSGSVGKVHRACLDQWRAVSLNPDSFTRCDICTTPYRYSVLPFVASLPCYLGLPVTYAAYVAY
jgi:E3 ubiquitin-protein ligase DOA10